MVRGITFIIATFIIGSSHSGDAFLSLIEKLFQATRRHLYHDEGVPIRDIWTAIGEGDGNASKVMIGNDLGNVSSKVTLVK